MSRARALPAVLLLPALLLAGCGGLAKSDNTNGQYGSLGNVVIVAPEDRQAPVDITGTSLEGVAVDLAEDRGEVTVVNIWWSLCGPCIAETPRIEQAHAALPGVAFVGIDIRDNSAATALAFQDNAHSTYPSIFDPGSTTLLRFGDQYPPLSMPSTVVLDRQGRVAALFSGAVSSAQTLQDVVQQVAGEDGAPDGPSAQASRHG